MHPFNKGLKLWKTKAISVFYYSRSLGRFVCAGPFSFYIIHVIRNPSVWYCISLLSIGFLICRFRDHLKNVIMKNLTLLWITASFISFLSCCPCQTEGSDCVKECDAQADIILKNYQDCQNNTEDNLVMAIQSCSELFPPFEGRVHCITEARQRAKDARQACEISYKHALAENRRGWIKCQQTTLKDKALVNAE